MKKITLILSLLLGSSVCFAGTPGTLSKFLGSSSIVNSYVSESTTTQTVTANASVVVSTTGSVNTMFINPSGTASTVRYWNGGSPLNQKGLDFFFENGYLRLRPLYDTTGSKGDAFNMDPDGKIGLFRSFPSVALDVLGDASISGRVTSSSFTLTEAPGVGYVLTDVLGNGTATWQAPTGSVPDPLSIGEVDAGTLWAQTTGVVFPDGSTQTAASYGSLEGNNTPLFCAQLNTGTAGLSDGGVSVWQSSSEEVAGSFYPNGIIFYNYSGVTASSLMGSYDGTDGGYLSLSTTSASIVADAQQAFMYSTGAASAEMWVMDGAGNATQISPHDPSTGKWIYSSVNVVTGKRVVIDMEKAVQLLEKLSGEKVMSVSYDSSVVKASIKAKKAKTKSDKEKARRKRASKKKSRR